MSFDRIRRKRGSYTKHKSRKYRSLQKTTTLLGRREYMRNLMRNKRGTPASRFFHPGRPPKPLRVDFEKALKRIRELV